ncbi:hypothetical protein SWPG_00118 [Synechococcus phage S-CBM2]|nr:hypothetical protein SWPG_00118 [Synechococcus phage S-CBM2]
MAKVTYRGCQYDTNTPKQEFRSWHRTVDCRDHVYRGHHYYPIQTMDPSTKKEIYDV